MQTAAFTSLARHVELWSKLSERHKTTTASRRGFTCTLPQQVNCNCYQSETCSSVGLTRYRLVRAPGARRPRITSEFASAPRQDAVEADSLTFVASVKRCACRMKCHCFLNLPGQDYNITPYIGEFVNTITNSIYGMWASISAKALQLILRSHLWHSRPPQGATT